MVQATATNRAAPVASARRSSLRRRRSERGAIRDRPICSDLGVTNSVMVIMIAISALSRFVIGWSKQGSMRVSSPDPAAPLGGTRWLANTSRFNTMSNPSRDNIWPRRRPVLSAAPGSPRCSGEWGSASSFVVTGAVSNSSASARRPAQVWSDAARLTGRKSLSRWTVPPVARAGLGDVPAEV